MRNLSGPFLITVLVVGLYLATAGAGAQQTGIVILRPRVTASAAGMPEVKATVDRNRVPLGDEVTFTLYPARVIADPNYQVTLYFGDGGRHVMRQPKTVHLYKTSGTYTYSILVEGPQRTSTAPVAPEVKLLATPNSVLVNQTVSFTAQLSHPYPNLRFRFVFDDGCRHRMADEPNREARLSIAADLPTLC